MKLLANFIFLILPALCYSQTKDNLNSKSKQSPKIASFITTLDIVNATKDGIYLNGYVVNISYAKMKERNGKRIKVTGKVTIVKGISDMPGEPISQGREENTKHILSPRIKVIKQ